MEIRDQQRDTEARCAVCIRMGGRDQGPESLVSRLGHAREGGQGPITISFASESRMRTRSYEESGWMDGREAMEMV